MSLQMYVRMTSIINNRGISFSGEGVVPVIRIRRRSAYRPVVAGTGFRIILKLVIYCPSKTRDVHLSFKGFSLLIFFSRSINYTCVRPSVTGYAFLFFFRVLFFTMIVIRRFERDPRLVHLTPGCRTASRRHFSTIIDNRM